MASLTRLSKNADYNFLENLHSNMEIFLLFYNNHILTFYKENGDKNAKRQQS